MVEENDWRLLNDVEGLAEKYLNPVGGDDVCENAPHLGHCIFCLDAVHNNRYEWWYVPEDISCCICERCYNDFKDRFSWKKLDGYDIDWSRGTSPKEVRK